MVFKALELILLALEYGTSSERSFIAAYNAGVLSSETFTLCWIYIAFFILFCLGSLCACCHTVVDYESGYSTRIVMCK